MAKPIWFPFYPTDFLSSSKVALMDTAEIGAYLLLLCHEWMSDDCSLPNDDEKLKKLSRFSGDLTLVKACFFESKGKLRNERLFEEWLKVKTIKDLGSKFGKQGAEKRWPQRVTGTCSKPVTGNQQGGSEISTGIEHSSPSPSQSPSEEEKIKKEKTLAHSSQAVCVVDPFDQFWACYPRKIGKEAARKVWAKIKNRPPVIHLTEAIARAKQTEQWKKDGGQFIPHPATWLNQGRWEDEPIEAVGVSDPNGFLAGLNAFIARGAS